MKQTVVAVFESPMTANETVHVLDQAHFIAERLPRISSGSGNGGRRSLAGAWSTIRRMVRDFLDADMYLQPYAEALAKGRFVVKVYVDNDAEALAASAILQAAGGTGIDFLADEPVLDCGSTHDPPRPPVGCDGAFGTSTHIVRSRHRWRETTRQAFRKMTLPPTHFC